MTRTVTYTCDLCRQSKEMNELTGFQRSPALGIIGSRLSAADFHVCDKCRMDIVATLPLPTEPVLSDDPKDLAELLQRVENQDHNSFSEDAEYLIARGVRVLRDTSRPDDRPDPGPSGLPPEVAGY